jgi:small GTP-binding protein
MSLVFCLLCVAGFPSVGKSSLLTILTGTESEAAAYEFTTLTCIPGVIHYNDAKIQLLDLPGIIEGAAQGKGRGRQVRRGAGHSPPGMHPTHSVLYSV